MSWQASGMVMKYLVTSGSVTVTGPPRAICSRNSGTTLPLEPSTFPKRTTTNRHGPGARLPMTSSAARLVAPITLAGRTALSVDTRTNWVTSCRIATCAAFSVPKHVVPNRLQHVQLGERHVLVRGRVEDERRPVRRECRLHLILEQEVAEHRRDLHGRKAIAQLALEEEHSVLVAVEQDEPRRSVRRHLTAQLGADGARGAGHQDGAIGDQRPHVRQVESHGLAGQQVVHLHVAHLGEHHATLDQLRQGGHHAMPHPRLATMLRDAAHDRAGG